MSKPPHDDPVPEWYEDGATLIELLPDDLAEIDREETTPTVDLRTHPAYRLGVDAALGAVDAILWLNGRGVPREKLDAMYREVRAKTYPSTDANGR